LQFLSFRELYLAMEQNDEIIKQLDALYKEKYDLQVQAEVNDPEVRRKFKNDMGNYYSIIIHYYERENAKLFDLFIFMFIIVDMSIPVYRHLKEKHWKSGPLPKLVSSITIIATKTDISGGTEILQYVPPHPPKGTKYHRYTLGAFEQSVGKIEVTKADLITNVREFANKYNLILSGATFFREVWDKDVSSIYRDRLGKYLIILLNTIASILVTFLTLQIIVKGIHEPIYGKPPKVDHYLDATGKKRPSKFIETLE
ncbi:9461_t:CDS:2, partial [Racocetra fulgida]